MSDGKPVALGASHGSTGNPLQPVSSLQLPEVHKFAPAFGMAIEGFPEDVVLTGRWLHPCVQPSDSEGVEYRRANW